MDTVCPTCQRSEGPDLRALCTAVVEAAQRFYDDSENLKNFEIWRQKRHAGDST